MHWPRIAWTLTVGLALSTTGACSDDKSGVGGQDSPTDTDAGGDSGDFSGDLDEGDLPLCLPAGDTCEGDSDCCSGVCDPESKQCGSSIQACHSTGDTCEAGPDCCSLSCVVGRCAEECTSDNEACTNDAECCGGKCENELCVPLNAACKTSGNTCDANTDCCSTLCQDGICALGASYCVQKGDVCRGSGDCCTGNCAIAEGEMLGTCGDAPDGPSNCSAGAAGTVCGDCNECCSRLCAPFGPSGVKICQPASGCRLTGELCRDDKDCCGGDETADLPGAGNVSCVKESGTSLGICRNAQSCSPQGNVCHFKDYTCSVSSAANKCCSGVGNSG
ncbi:MAG TPA: hypothetical protein VLC09_10430, partial [Polyangiaceae bacterium]|nr:hypothetical protein [Polyangiaceae bacterium]